MSELVASCSRCGSQRMTFDVTQDTQVGRKYDWQRLFEAFAVCRECRRATLFKLSQVTPSFDSALSEGVTKCRYGLNQVVRVEGHVNLKDAVSISPPEHVPENIRAAFQEAATCFAVGCHNAAGAMLRLCLDLGTLDLLPVDATQEPNARTRRDLGLRLPWLFNNGLLPPDLRELLTCVKEDGNDAAHRGNLTEADTSDLLDFTIAFLSRRFTEPARVRLATERRAERRSASKLVELRQHRLLVRLRRLRHQPLQVDLGRAHALVPKQQLHSMNGVAVRSIHLRCTLRA